MRRVLDWMIGFIAPYTVTTLGTTGNTALSLIYTLYNSPLHTQYNSQSSLAISWQRMDTLSLQITHEIFFAQPNLSLSLSLRLPIPKIRLQSIPLRPSSYPGRMASRNSILHFRLDYSTTVLFTLSCLLPVSFHNTSTRNTQKAQPLLLRRCVYWSVT
jgi:hypothetical protein